MSRELLKAIVLGLTLVCGGCAASLPVVKLDKAASPARPYESLAVGYSKSYFQSRFMGKSIGIITGTAVAFGPMVAPIGVALWQGLGNYEERVGARTESNEYEKLLGDFDTTDFFFRQLELKLRSAQHFRFTFTKDVETAAKIVSTIKQSTATEKAIADRMAGRSYSSVAAFKLSYGLGLRQGSEQLGFRKYYRPFVRVVGSIRNLESNKVIWQDTIIGFSEQRYLGSEADADKIPSGELVSAMKQISTEATDLLLRSLNGDELTDLPVLVDTVNADFEF